MKVFYGSGLRTVESVGYRGEHHYTEERDSEEKRPVEFGRHLQSPGRVVTIPGRVPALDLVAPDIDPEPPDRLAEAFD